MEPWENEDIVKFIRGVEKEVSPDLKSFCDTAKFNFDTIYGKINLNHRKKIEPVSTLIDDVAHLRVCKHEDIKEAVSILNEYILPFLKEEERNRAKSEKQQKNGSTSDVLKKDDDKRTATVKNEKQIVENSPRTTLTEHEKPPLTRGADGLAVAFRELFHTSSRELLFQDITKLRNSQSLGFDCLLHIVMKLFEISKKEADEQMSRAEECAKQIVETGKFDPKKIETSRKSTDEVLRRYRYIHADIATERLQRLMLQEVRDLLIMTYNIDMKENKNLIAFTRDCAEITWLMCVEDPSLDMVNDTNELNDNIYDIEKRKPCNAIVWPALKFHGSQNIFLKGIAWCK